MFRTRYADVYAGDERWQAIEITGGDTYSWPAASTYIQNPPYFTGMTMTPVPLKDVVEARALAVFGNSITTDHISPAGAIKLESPAGSYLIGKDVAAARIQQLWRAPRQSSSDDARHLRQHPHPQPHARQCRGRLHALRADRRNIADL